MDILHADQEKPHTSFTRVIQELYNIPGYIIIWLLLCVCLICPAMRFYCLQLVPKTNPKKDRTKSEVFIPFYTQRYYRNPLLGLVVMVFSPCTHLYMSGGHTGHHVGQKVNVLMDFFYFFSLPSSRRSFFNFCAGLIHVRYGGCYRKCLGHLILFFGKSTQIKRDNNTWSSVTTANLSCAHVWWETPIQTLKMQRKWRRQEMEREKERENRLVDG